MGPAVPLIACSASRAPRSSCAAIARARGCCSARCSAPPRSSPSTSRTPISSTGSATTAPRGRRGALGVALVAALAAAVRAASRPRCRWPRSRRCRSGSRSSIGGSTANLLLPLYLVIAAGTLAGRCRASAAERRPPRRGRLGRDARRAAPATRRALARGGLEWTLAVVLVLYALQAAWSSDSDRALENVVFFYVPFAVLFALLSRLAWTPRIAAASLGVLSGLAAGARGDRLRRVRDAPPAAEPEGDRLEPGRGLLPRQLAVLRPEHLRPLPGRRAGAARRLVAVAGATRDVALAGLLCALLFGGLVLTLSQSSFAALLAGLAVLGGLRWNPRWAALAAPPRWSSPPRRRSSPRRDISIALGRPTTRPAAATT